MGRKPDTIAIWENAAVKELALHLISARYATSPFPDGIPPMHGTAIHERIDITVLVRDRLWTETREIFRTIPLIDDVEYFEISSDIPAVITAISDIIVRSKTPNNGLSHRFYFKEKLKRGKPAEISFIMKPDGTRDAELTLKEETRAFHLPTLAHGMEIMFIGDRPKIIWHYSHLPLYERPGVPTKKQLIDLAGGGSARVEWSDLYGGLYSGIAWEWE